MSFFTALVTSKIAAGALAAGTLVVGGTTAAAYTGTLPEPLQQSAHNLLGAPAPADSADLAEQAAETAAEAAEAEAAAEAAEAEAAAEAAEAEAAAEAAEAEAGPDSTESTPNENESATPVGPDATGSAAYGLCQSFTNGGLEASSTAYKSLVVAAGGETNIAIYCATVASPGESASHRPAEIEAGTAAAQIPVAPQLPQQAVVPVAPQLPQQAVVPVAPQLPQQAVVPVAPQRAESGNANKPATAGRP